MKVEEMMEMTGYGCFVPIGGTGFYWVMVNEVGEVVGAEAGKSMANIADHLLAHGEPDIPAMRRDLLELAAELGRREVGDGD